MKTALLVLLLISLIFNGALFVRAQYWEDQYVAMGYAVYYERLKICTANLQRLFVRLVQCETGGGVW